MPKQVVFHETGDADVLKIEDQPVCEPGAGEVRINVAAIGLNRAEIMFRRGNISSNHNFLPGWGTRHRASSMPSDPAWRV